MNTALFPPFLWAIKPWSAVKTFSLNFLAGQFFLFGRECLSLRAFSGLNVY
jgi:hypothetical protein